MDAEGFVQPNVASPWRTIWFSPRQTMRRIIDSEVRPTWVPVIALAALHQAFASLRLDPAGEAFSLSSSAMPVALGMLQLVFGVLVGPFLLAFVGSWFGGEADPTEIRQAVAWSYVPYAVAGLFWVPVLIAFGGPPRADDGVLQGLLALLLILAVLAALLWSFVLHVVTFAEVQRFSIGRSLASIIILMIPLMLLAAIG